MTDKQRIGRRLTGGRTIVTDDQRQLIEEGDASRLEICRIFHGDLKSLIAASLSLLGAEDEIPAITEGGHTLVDVAVRLEGAGVHSRIAQADSLEDVAMAIVANSAVVLVVNAGELLDNAAFFDCGHANQLVMPAYAYRDPESLRLIGFDIHSPSGETASKRDFVTAEKLKDAWLETGGRMLIATAENIV